MAGPGNTPYQVGPGESTDVVIPGDVAFYGGTPAAQSVVAAPDSTTNLTLGIAMLHATLSQTVVALKAVSLIA